MLKKCDHDNKTFRLCDVCLKTEIEPVAGKHSELRDMWEDDGEEGLVLCEECVSSG